MKKIIFVAVAVGRCGSSMVTGMLNKAGVNAGKNPCSVKSVVNPGGFYEVKDVRDFCYNHYYDHMNAFKPMFTFDMLRDQKTKPEFINILDDNYGDKYPIVVKALDFLPIALFENDPNYDIRILWVSRAMHDQAKSIRSMWSDKGPSLKWWEDLVEQRFAWTTKFLDEFKFPYLPVDFNTVLDQPEKEAKRIFDFCDIEVQDMQPVLEWVNPKFSRSRT